LRNILIVDDDELIRTTVALALRSAGYRVLEADDGDTALSIARAERPHLILLDAIMPRLDGFATLGAMRLDPLLARTPVIMLTSLRRPEDVQRALRLSVSGYVVKPIDLPLLMHRTERVLLQNVSEVGLEWID
jgi:DNA-binding response OmpR family regulator